MPRLGLAIATDVVYVADTAKIGSPFVNIGALLDSGGHAIGCGDRPEHVGPADEVAAVRDDHPVGRAAVDDIFAERGLSYDGVVVVVRPDHPPR